MNHAGGGGMEFRPYMYVNSTLTQPMQQKQNTGE